MHRIRTRLIVAFLLVALLPAIPLSLVVRNLLERSFNPATSRTLEESLAAGLDESRERLREEKSRFEEAVRAHWQSRIGDELASSGVGGHGIVFIDRARPERRVESAPDDSVRLERVRKLQGYVGLPEVADAGGEPGTVLIGPVRVGDCLAVVMAGGEGGTITVAQPLPDGMVGRAEKMTEGVGLLSILQQDRARVLRSYIVPFLLVYGLLLGIAVLIGAVLARRLAKPIEALAASTRQVAAGDLQTRVGLAAQGEIGDLVNSFNGMVEQLGRQRRKTARLERLAAWRDMARTLAHEIKNPLTPILLAVQSARESYRGPDLEHARLLADCEEIVQEEVDGLRKLVREFSEFARLPRPQPAPGDLSSLIQELSRLYGAEKVSCDPAAQPLRSEFDAAELRRALINLIDNGLAACAAAGRPEKVSLAARREGESVLLAVADGGCGIPPENLARIFEPNFSTKTEGMGLGLCIVDQIVRGHDGSIDVTSEPDRGTVFAIRLPAGETRKDAR